MIEYLSVIQSYWHDFLINTDIRDIISLVKVVIIAYLIGSIPTGYIVVKLLKGEDIRKIGSGSTGATNVKRVLGKGWFFAVLLLDAIKGAAPVVWATYHVYAYYDWGLSPVLASLFVLIGHSKSIFLKFTGGKSVASGVGTLLGLCWPVGLIIAAIWASVTYFSKYVSLGSIVALALSPLIMAWFNQPILYVSYCAIGAAYIIYLHRENIKRLLKGEENKVR